jgi:putative membrane protein
LVPSLLPVGTDDFRQHVLQHLVIGMYAPLGLVLGAPITLLLRSVPVATGGRIGRILRSTPMRIVSNTYLLLVMNIGGLAVLYFTPLYVESTQHQAVHHLVHLHFFLVGYGFAWAIAGSDPAPRRPSVPKRLAVLGVAILGHAVIAQLLYAGIWVEVPVTAAELKGGADLMYYGGDIGELLLALAVVTTWRPYRSVARPLDPGSRHASSVVTST